MKQLSQIVVITLLCLSSLQAQVGIGNTNPQAQLDISASSTTSPTYNDGILIPRMSVLPANASMTANQDGMLVFYTDTGLSGKGFYYWNQSIPNWVKVASGAKNTLDQAYDEGGPGAGKNITADNGPIRVNGTDGLLITGTYNTGATIDTEVTGLGTRMFFNPRKGAFRAGYVTGAHWDDSNIGSRSVAFGASTIASGQNSTALGASTTASGEQSAAFGWLTQASGYGSTAFGYQSIASVQYSIAFGHQSTANTLNAIAFGNQTLASGGNSTAFGSFTTANGVRSTAFGSGSTASGSTSTAFGQSSTASGAFSTAFGIYTNAYSYNETVLGSYNTIYIPSSTNSFNTNDKILVIGNGTSLTSRSNALTIYKSGLMNINDEYNMPLTDGSANQVMATDGAGVVSFIDAPSDNDWLEIGTGNPPNAIGDDIYTHGQVHIGTNTLSDASLYISSPNIFSNGLYVNKTSNGSGSSPQVGIRSTNSTLGSNPHYGVSSEMGGSGTGRKTNFRALNNSTNATGTNLQSLFDGTFQGNAGNYDLYGNKIYFFNTPTFPMTNTGTKYGYQVDIIPAIPGTHYGVYSNVLKTNSYSGYFLGRVFIGTSPVSGYILPTSDGTVNQVLTTAGDGTTSWAAISIPVGTLIDVTTYGANYAAIAPVTYEQPRFYIENNRVYIEGTIVKTAGTPNAGDVLFTLPVGYRPLKQRIFTGTQNGTNTIRIDVAANGNVVALSASPVNFISLEGISFRID